MHAALALSNPAYKPPGFTITSLSECSEGVLQVDFLLHFHYWSSSMIQPQDAIHATETAVSTILSAIGELKDQDDSCIVAVVLCSKTHKEGSGGMLWQTAVSIVYTSHYLSALHYHAGSTRLHSKNYKTINITTHRSTTYMYIWPQMHSSYPAKSISTAQKCYIVTPFQYNA